MGRCQMLTCGRCGLGAVSGFGLDYLPAPPSSAASDTSWHQAGPTGNSWTNQESPMEESSSTVLLDSLKVRRCPPEAFSVFRSSKLVSVRLLLLNVE